MRVVLKAAGALTITAAYEVDAGTSGSILGGAATGRAVTHGGVAATRSATLAVAAYGAASDSTTKSGVTPTSLVRRDVVGESRDSLLPGRDGFQSATHTPGTANCPGMYESAL